MYIENKQLKNQVYIWLGTMFFIISIMIVVGGLTRLTDSGLSITKWELFSGFLPPLNENQWFIYYKFTRPNKYFIISLYYISIVSTFNN